MKILLTRPADDSARIAEPLAATAAECLVWPLTQIVTLTDRVEVPEGTEALLFTSANAVRAFAAASPMRDLPVLTVGERTAETARAAGFGRVTSARGDARDLARLARAARWRRYLHPRGRDAACDLAAALAGAGITVDQAVLYAAEPAGPPPPAVARALELGEVDLFTVWSPRGAAILGDWLAAHGAPLGGADLLGISANAVAPLRDAGFRRVAVAERPDAAAMLGWISRALQP